MFPHYALLSITEYIHKDREPTQIHKSKDFDKFVKFSKKKSRKWRTFPHSHFYKINASQE